MTAAQKNRAVCIAPTKEIFRGKGRHKVSRATTFILADARSTRMDILNQARLKLRRLK
jgi:cobalamin biosynthesis protein CbiG